ncbi:MAG: hypothetical protein CL881_03975, partial [Dehalococcoidia bacterium]|nr:hypothetical protein [Dehalococcoidia bacterium]
SNQGSKSIAIGLQAGRSNQRKLSVAIGTNVGEYNQGSTCVAIGHLAGYCNQTAESVAIGNYAGMSNQGWYSVAIGNEAGRSNQGSQSVAIGNYAGSSNQGTFSVAIGKGAGSNNQGAYCTAIGELAGSSNQGVRAIAIGDHAGKLNQEGQTVAIGGAAGFSNQGCYAVAIGRDAGNTNQGSFSVAIGYQAGRVNQGSRSIVISAIGLYEPTTPDAFFVKPIRSANGVAMQYDATTGEITYSSSDDRLKVDEKYISDATTTLMKLTPQEYYKKYKIDEPRISHYESGLMAQDVWYDVPELRHTVHHGAYSNPTIEKPNSNINNPSDDPDYSAWGSEPAQVDYTQIIPYTVKAIQEIVTELPRTKTTVSNIWGQENVTGLIVSANTNSHKNGPIPNVKLSNTWMDTSWYGVISNKKTDTKDYDTLVDTKGDVFVWVTDVNGSVTSGDLITTSNISPGYAQKQDDDIIHSFTVAKLTQDCDFTTTFRNIRRPKKELREVTYYITKNRLSINVSEFDKITNPNHKTTDTTTLFRLNEDETISEEEYNKLNEDEQTKYTEEIKTNYYRIQITEHTFDNGDYDVTETREENVNVYDTNGQIVWEDTGETEPTYTLIDNGTYKAALLSCKII